MASKEEKVKIKRVRVNVRRERQSTYRFCPSPFLLNALLRPPNFRVDTREVGCDRLSSMTLWSMNGGFNNDLTRILGILTLEVSTERNEQGRSE
jgi:hypothetical protein